MVLANICKPTTKEYLISKSIVNPKPIKDKIKQKWNIQKENIFYFLFFIRYS